MFARQLSAIVSATTNVAPSEAIHEKRILKAILALSAWAALALVIIAASATASASVATCKSFRFQGAQDSSLTYRASGIKRAAKVPCRKVRQLIRGTYNGGWVREVYPNHSPDGSPSGRPIDYFHGGWRCSTGAGGVGCWNVTHKRYNVIDSGGTQKGAITANIDVS